MKLHKLFKTLAASWLLFLVAIGAHAGPVVTVGAGERARLVFDLGAYQPLWRFDLTLVVPPFAAGAAFQTQLWEQTDALSGLRQDWGVQTVGGGGFAYRGQAGDSYFDVLTDGPFALTFTNLGAAGDISFEVAVANVFWFDASDAVTSLDLSGMLDIVVEPVPAAQVSEPGSLALLAVAALGAGLARRRLGPTRA